MGPTSLASHQFSCKDRWGLAAGGIGAASLRVQAYGTERCMKEAQRKMKASEPVTRHNYIIILDSGLWEAALSRGLLMSEEVGFPTCTCDNYVPVANCKKIHDQYEIWVIQWWYHGWCKSGRAYRLITVAEVRLCHPHMYLLRAMPKLSTQTTSTHWPKHVIFMSWYPSESFVPIRQ